MATAKYEQPRIDQQVTKARKERLEDCDHPKEQIKKLPQWLAIY